MRRDLDLIRALLLKLEALPLPYGASVHLEPASDVVAVEGYTAEQIGYHLDQIDLAGLIEVARPRPRSGIVFRRLTPSGHDYLDAVRNPDTWRQTRDRAEKAGGWTLGIIKDIGVALIRGELQKHGLPLG